MSLLDAEWQLRSAVLRMLPVLAVSSVFRGAFAVEGGVTLLARIIGSQQHTLTDTRTRLNDSTVSADADAEVVAALSGAGAAQQHLSEIAAATQAVISLTDAHSVCKAHFVNIVLCCANVCM